MSYNNYAIQELIFLRQHVMEASNAKNDLFLTYPTLDKIMTFAFEFPMSGIKSAMFADDGKGESNSDIQNYIENTYSPDPIRNHDVQLSWEILGWMLRFSLKMNLKNRFPGEIRRNFETEVRKYYGESAVLICRPSNRNGLAASFKLLGGSTDISGHHNHDG
jgi:hypothetical protein